MLTSEEIAQLLAALVPAIWSNSQRTLTQSGITLTIPSTTDTIVIYRNGTVDFSITGLGPLNLADEIWFTIKDNLDAPDSDAILQITKVSGLTILNGQVSETPTDGTLTIDDLVTGTISIHLNALSAKSLPIYNPTLNTPPWDVKVRYTNAIVLPIKIGNTQILSSATTSLDVLT